MTTDYKPAYSSEWYWAVGLNGAWPGWPSVWGLGAAEHPVDPDYPMAYERRPLQYEVWDERLQLEYSIFPEIPDGPLVRF